MSSVVKDPELLAFLKPVWRRHGCAFCARTVPEEGTESGFDIELAHVMARGMGGGRRRDVADNILGLCGGLSDNRCHPRFDKHELAIVTNTAGDECWEVKHGAPLTVRDRELRFGYVRHLPAAMLAARDNGSPQSQTPIAAGALLQGALSAQRGGSTGAAPVSSPPPTTGYEVAIREEAEVRVEHTPETRLQLIRELIIVAERNRLAAALLLLKAWEEREYEALGRSWPEYYVEAGIGKSEASKMLKVASTFRGMLTELPPADAAELSLERAYYAARLVKEEKLSHSDALAAAVSTPSSGLVALLKDDEPADRCECPKCGSNHVRKTDDG